MKIAACQTDIAWEDPPENFRRLGPKIAAAAAAGARLVVLPEMYACGFSMETERIAEAEDGPSTGFLVEQARANSVWVCGSIPILGAGAGRPFNTLVLASPDGQTHHYRKIHPFTFAGEHEHYDAGSRFVTVDVEGLRVTLFVCYDLRFADEFWATATDTDCYVVVANWPERRRHHWTTLLRARAIENQAFVVGVNRVGTGGKLAYTGDSMIVDPWGEVLASGAKTEALLVAEVDPAVVAQARRVFPVLADRR
jgi:predicted amidohydrolase